MKTCARCKLEQTVLNFRHHAKSKDGLHPYCQSCEANYRRSYYATPRGLAIKKYADMRKRAENADGRHPSYQDVKLLVSRQDFLDWAIPALTIFANHCPGVRPSIDRINPDGHYHLSNMRIISWAENRALARSIHTGHYPAKPPLAQGF